MQRCVDMTVLVSRYACFLVAWLHSMRVFKHASAYHLPLNKTTADTFRLFIHLPLNKTTADTFSFVKLR